MADTRPHLAHVGADWLTQDQRASSRRPDHAEEHPDRGGLARAVESEEAIDLGSPDPQVESIDRENAVRVPLRQAVGLDRELGVHPQGHAAACGREAGLSNTITDAVIAGVLPAR